MLSQTYNWNNVCLALGQQAPFFSPYLSSDMAVSPTGITRPKSLMISFAISLIKAENIVGDKLFPYATQDRQSNYFVVLSLIFIVAFVFSTLV